MSERTDDVTQWQAWVDKACEAVGVDVQNVDITAILGLTKRVAHNLERPLAPVSSYIVGVAVGMAAAAGEVSREQREQLMQQLLTVVPRTPNPN